jgi:Polysaccharide pyruvyl transferase
LEQLVKFIQSCTVVGGNFGDDINLYLWETIFPNLHSLQSGVHFYGIGTVLGGIHHPGVKKVVLGSGLGETHSISKDNNWEFHWVRGPLTAKEFGLPMEAALGDPAILLPELTPGHDLNGPVGLIPHYATWDSYDWVTIAANVGMVAIDPHQAPNQVISQMRKCSRIMAESLHGAICADAMGIPWAVCILAHRFNEFKWRDWMATINRPFKAFVIDRPLVAAISYRKSVANRLARLLKYKQDTRCPALRPVAVSSVEDVRMVEIALSRYSLQGQHFSCSQHALIAQQRHKMHKLCAEFASQYHLEYCDLQ